jgi:hypothetical protein
VHCVCGSARVERGGEAQRMTRDRRGLAVQAPPADYRRAGTSAHLAATLARGWPTRSARAWPRRSGCAAMKLAHLGVDLLAPAAAGEDAVVAGALHVVVELRSAGMPVHRSCAALVWPAPEMSSSSPSMVSSAVVVMSCGRTGSPCTLPGAVDQREVLEHGLDGVEVVLGRHVEHGVVLVVELAVRLGAVVVAADQVEEVVVVARQVAVGVHRHEAGVLQEARVDAAPGAGVVGRHAEDDVVLEPGRGSCSSPGC